MASQNKTAAAGIAAAAFNRAQSLAALRSQDAKFHRVAQLRIILDALVGASDEAPTRDLELRWRDLAAGCADLIGAEARAALCGRGAV
jgi:hypothetical protein